MAHSRRYTQPRSLPLSLRLLDSLEHEEERVLSAIAGDTDARNWIAAHYAPPIYRYCLRMLRHTQEAEEICQEVLLRALRNLHRYDPQRSFKTWIFSIARNACIDQHRKKRPIPSDSVTVMTDPDELADTQLERRTRAERLNKAVSDLPDLYREVIVLYHFEHLKYQEIAETLDLPMGTVMNRIFRARKKLRERLGGAI